MKSTENQADVNLLEIHRMAVDNAIRQQENRQAIARLRIDHEKDIQDLRKDVAESKLNLDTFLSKAEKHLDRAAELQEEIRQIQRETRELQKETAQQIKDTDRQIEDTDRQIKETARQIEDTDRQMKETDRKIKELSTRFSSTTGHIIEGLMSSSAIKIYEDKGFKINSLCKNYKRKNKQLNLEMEQDVVLFTETQVIVEEVKASCDKKDVEKFFHNMEKFKLLYDEYADKEVFGAVAAVNYEDGADTYARNLGLFVVRVSSDEIFSLDPFKMEELKRF
jgi:predicted RNase H-like nuclease (RuvC/YqgF family)